LPMLIFNDLLCGLTTSKRGNETVYNFNPNAEHYHRQEELDKKLMDAPRPNPQPYATD